MADLMMTSLRRLQPARVKVYDAADESREIAVPTRRRKWAQVIQTITARPWVRCELLDKAGAILGYVDNDDEAGDLEPISDDRAINGQTASMRMILEAQRVALSYRDKEHVQLLQGVAEVMKVQTDAIKQLVQLYQLQVNAAAEVASMQAHAEAGGDLSEWVKLAEAAPQLAGTLIPMLRLMAGTRQAPKGKPIAPPSKPEIVK